MLSLAMPRKTWAHRIPTGIKFATFGVLMAGMAFVTNPVALAIALVATAAFYATLGRDGIRAGLRAIRPVIWIVALIVAWQLWQNDVTGAVVLALRIFVMMGMANFITLTTPLPDLIAMIERIAAPMARFGLSPRMPALAIALMIRFVPVLRDRMQVLGLAWRARSRKRPGPRLFAPMILSLLDDSDHLADALRARGGLAPPPQQRKRK